MKTVCDIDKCAGCMACIDICSRNVINIQYNIKSYNAVIDEELCINCNACHKVCQVNHQPKLLIPLKWYQGWSTQSEIRLAGSSGGVAMALSKKFIRDGGIVWSCVFEKGKFVFQQAETLDELVKFSGSKYVKSNPVGAYKAIYSCLNMGKRVLFIGLPCQVSSLKNFVGPNLDERLYTVDLICHGTPSPQVLETYLDQYGYKLSELKDIRFRNKKHYQIYLSNHDVKDYKGITENGVTDCYLITFLNSLCYTENCYSCNYARTERVSDITIGDSWGSNLPDLEKQIGISLILIQTEKGLKLVENSDLHLENVDINNAIAKNHQLRAPAVKPKVRDEFILRLQTGESFNTLVRKYYPKQCYKQELKKWMIKLHLISRDKR